MDFALDQPASSISVLCALIVTEPVEHLSAAMQHVDKAGGGLLDLLADSSPLAACLSCLTSLVERGGPKRPDAAAALALIAGHFTRDSERTVALDAVVEASLRVAAQAWARFALPCNTRPLKLFAAPARHRGLARGSVDAVFVEFLVL